MGGSRKEGQLDDCSFGGSGIGLEGDGREPRGHVRGATDEDLPHAGRLSKGGFTPGAYGEQGTDDETETERELRAEGLYAELAEGQLFIPREGISFYVAQSFKRLIKEHIGKRPLTVADESELGRLIHAHCRKLFIEEHIRVSASFTISNVPDVSKNKEFESPWAYDLVLRVAVWTKGGWRNMHLAPLRSAFQLGSER